MAAVVARYVEQKKSRTMYRSPPFGVSGPSPPSPSLAPPTRLGPPAIHPPRHTLKSSFSPHHFPLSPFPFLAPPLPALPLSPATRAPPQTDAELSDRPWCQRSPQRQPRKCMSESPQGPARLFHDLVYHHIPFQASSPIVKHHDKSVRPSLGTSVHAKNKLKKTDKRSQSVIERCQTRASERAVNLHGRQVFPVDARRRPLYLPQTINGNTSECGAPDSKHHVQYK